MFLPLSLSLALSRSLYLSITCYLGGGEQPLDPGGIGGEGHDERGSMYSNFPSHTIFFYFLLSLSLTKTHTLPCYLGGGKQPPDPGGIGGEGHVEGGCNIFFYFSLTHSYIHTSVI